MHRRDGIGPPKAQFFVPWRQMRAVTGYDEFRRIIRLEDLYVVFFL